MWSALYLCCLLLAGYALLNWLSIRVTRVERFGLAIILGPGIFGFCLVFLSMLGIQPARGEIILQGGVFAIIAILAGIWRRRAEPIYLPPEKTPVWILLLCPIAIGYGLYAIGTDVLVFPTLEWDAFAIWQLKAKMLATFPLYPRPAYFFDVRLSYSHLRYPLLWPMICAGIDAANQSLREGLGKIPAYLFYLGTGICIYGTVRRSRGRTAAIIAAGLVLTAPVVYRYGGSGTAEMALTAFYTASIICILRWQQEQRWGDLILCGLFSAAMAWTKNEGQALALINAIVILVLSPRPLGRKNILAVLAFAGIVLVLFIPWLIYIHPLPRSDEDYANRLNLYEMSTHLYRLPAIAWAMITEVVNFKDWGIFWILLAALAALERGSPTSRTIRTLWVLLILQALVYFPPYIVANWDLDELLPATVDRLFMHMMPAAALLIGLLWPRPVLTVNAAAIE